MVLKINITLPDETDSQADSAVTEREVCVSEDLSSVSKSNMEAVISKMAQVLDAQGISCFQCPKSIYKLYPLSDAYREDYISHIQKGAVRFGMAVSGISVSAPITAGDGRRLTRTVLKFVLIPRRNISISFSILQLETIFFTPSI